MRTSRRAKKSLAQSRTPRISTRGYYDLTTGKTLRKKPYDLYPKKFFESLGKEKEFTIMIHGLRNDVSGAIAKFKIAKKRLLQLGYRYPVVGFSYDSNTKGVQYKSTELKATKVGRIIAKKNGRNLARFIADFKKQHPDARIRLMGHSLGSEVILYTLAALKKKKGVVEAVYFFGGSIPATSVQPQKFGKILQSTVRHKVLNYFSPDDDVLKHAYEHLLIEKPIGYLGNVGKVISKYSQKKVTPKNHRFVSYSLVITNYP